LNVNELLTGVNEFGAVRMAIIGVRMWVMGGAYLDYGWCVWQLLGCVCELWAVRIWVFLDVFRGID
jgi:hypothetical protein